MQYRMGGCHLDVVLLHAFMRKKDPTYRFLHAYLRWAGIAPNNSSFIHCPIHRDTRPSLKIYPGDRGWYCFSCGKYGGPIQLHAYIHGIRFKEAYLKLKKIFPLSKKGLPPLEVIRDDRDHVFNQWERRICSRFWRLLDGLSETPFHRQQLCFCFWDFGVSILDRARELYQEYGQVEILERYAGEFWEWFVWLLKLSIKEKYVEKKS